MANHLVPDNFIFSLRIVHGADWRNLPASHWIRANKQRCMICHPSPYPPFPDCPHGHYLTPWRIEQQLRHEWRSDFVWYTGFSLICSIFMAGGLIIGLFIWATYLLFFIPFIISHIAARGIARNLYRTGVAYDDGPTFVWEKATRRNEPWNRRYYP